MKLKVTSTLYYNISDTVSKEYLDSYMSLLTPENFVEDTEADYVEDFKVEVVD